MTCGCESLAACEHLGLWTCCPPAACSSSSPCCPWPLSVSLPACLHCCLPAHLPACLPACLVLACPSHALSVFCCPYCMCCGVGRKKIWNACGSRRRSAASSSSYTLARTTNSSSSRGMMWAATPWGASGTSLWASSLPATTTQTQGCR